MHLFRDIGAFTGTAMKLTHTLLALLVAVLALPMAAVGQDEEESIKVASADGAIENIVVTGEKSWGELRRELWQVEDDFYSLYNKLNDSAAYDVHCAREAPTGSRIKQQVCRPEFLVRALNRGDIISKTSMKTSSAIAGKMENFREILDTLMAANPELQSAADTYGTARARFMAQSETRANN
jgi:hypothetical protein